MKKKTRTYYKIPTRDVTLLVMSVLIFVPVLVFGIIQMNKPQSKAEGNVSSIKGSSVSGYIKSATGKPIVGGIATILVDGHRRSAAVNNNGYYEILDLAPGRYQMTFSAKGYVAKISGVDIVGGVTHLDTTLEK